jgi:hypothetical protein
MYHGSKKLRKQRSDISLSYPWVLYQFFHENRRFFSESPESMMGLAVL